METRTLSTSLVRVLFVLSVVSVTACEGNYSGSPLQPTPVPPAPAAAMSATPVETVAAPQVSFNQEPAAAVRPEAGQVSGATVPAAPTSTPFAAAALDARKPIYVTADYDIVTGTCDVANAGTDANILIYIDGERGSSGWINLDNPNANDLERSHNDRFSGTVSPIIPGMHNAPNIGTPYSFTIFNDGSGNNPSWAMCGLVVVVKTPDGAAKSRLFSSSLNWINAGEVKTFYF